MAKIKLKPIFAERRNVPIQDMDYPPLQAKAILKHYLGPRKGWWSQFKKWMRGQTRPVLDNGILGYYKSDVFRFISWKLWEITPLWD